jgi:hypothetical protein
MKYALPLRSANWKGTVSVSILDGEGRAAPRTRYGRNINPGLLVAVTLGVCVDVRLPEPVPVPDIDIEGDKEGV